MKKLELKHIAPYLPYKLKAKQFGKTLEMVCQPHKDNHIALFAILVNTQAKPILRPLSDLTKEIEHNGKKFVPLDRLTSRGFALANYRKLPYGDIEKLFEWHFDVFGLIDQGLATDINQLKQEEDKK